jgi:hypothetical protein
MAKIEPGAVGEFRGKFKDSVVTKWLGLVVARSLPTKTSKTPKQATIEKRHRFGVVSQLLKPYIDIIRIGYPSNRRSCTSMNLVVKSTLKNAVVGSYPDWALDPHKLQLSCGPLSQVYNVKLEVDKDDPYQFNIVWQNPIILRMGLSGLDRIQVFVLSDVPDENRLGRLYQDAAHRSDCSCTIRLPKFRRVGIQVWMFLLSENGKEASPTVYLGEFASAFRQ